MGRDLNPNAIQSEMDGGLQAAKWRARLGRNERSAFKAVLLPQGAEGAPDLQNPNSREVLAGSELVIGCMVWLSRR